MKRELILAAFAVVAMASCSKTEVADPSANIAERSSVGFTTFIDRLTKGAVANQATLQTNGFGAICYEMAASGGASQDWTVGTEASAVLMNDYKVEYNAGAWKYDGVTGTTGNTQTLQYWNEGSTLSFFAYSPFSSNYDISDVTGITTATSNAAPFFTFTTQTGIKMGIDLLASSVINIKNTGSPVHFDFDHILSKIGFTVEPSVQADNSGVAVKAIKVQVVDNASTDGTSKEYLRADGKFTFNTAKTGTTTAAWDITGSTTALVINEEAVSKDTDFDFDTANPSGGTPNSFKLVKGDAAKDIMKADGYLMIIPQDMTGNDIIKVTVTYNYISDVTNGTVDATEITKVVYIPAIEYEMSKQYTYNIKVGRDAIVFDKTIGVSAWLAGSDVNIE